MGMRSRRGSVDPSVPNQNSNDATCGLWAAILGGDDGAAIELLPNADVRAVNADGRDAMMWAAYLGRPLVVEKLLPLSDLSAIDASGRDAAMWAAAGGSGRAVALIADKMPQAAFERVDGAGETAMTIAARAGRGDALRVFARRHWRSQSVLVEQALARAVDTCPEEAFWIAAEHSHPGAAAELIEKISPTAKDEQGRTALHVAAKFGLVDQTRRLLAHGADARARAARNVTPLMSAAGALSAVPEADVVAIVDALNPVSDALWEDDDGFTALSLAAQSGRPGVVEALLPHGDADSAGHAYGVAVRERKADCVAVLAPRVARSGRVDPLRDIQGKTLRKASDLGDAGAVERMLKGQPTFAQRKLGVLDAPPIAERPDAGGRDALMLAARRGHAECVASLLPFANPRRRDLTGKTALMHAAESSSVESVRLLLPASNVSARDRLGLTALMWAAKSRFEGCQILDLLLPGSVAEAVDHIGRNASFYAVESARASKAEKLAKCVPPTGVQDGRRE